MRKNELWAALKNRRPVVAKWPTTGEILFKRVSAVIARVDEHGEVNLTAELESNNGMSVTFASPKNIEYA